MSRSKMGELLGAACLTVSAGLAVAYRESGWEVVTIILAVGVALCALAWAYAYGLNHRKLEIRFDSQTILEKMDAQEAVFLIAGHIANPRDTPVGIKNMAIRVKLSDGETVDATFDSPPLPHTLPFKNEMLTFNADQFWPIQLDKGQIQPHGVSHGFVLGRVSGFPARRLFDAGTEVELSVTDADGVTSSSKATKKNSNVMVR